MENKYSQWRIKSDGISENDILSNGNRMLIGNGYMGYRGTLEEMSLHNMPSLILNGVYDRHENKWREPVNFPNPFFIQISSGKKIFNIQNTESLKTHSQEINYRYGVFSRKTEWDDICVQSRRFASMEIQHLMCLEYSITAKKNCSIKIECKIDTDVYDCNGPHFEKLPDVPTETNTFFKDSVNEKNIISVLCKTLELKIPFVVSHVVVPSAIEFSGNEKFAENSEVSLVEGQTLNFCVYASIYSGTDYDLQRNGINEKIVADSRSLLRAASSSNFETLLTRHLKRWDAIWENGDVEIEGDDLSSESVRFSLYQLQIIAPRGNKDLSIPARGLSGQTYKGAVFWDTEMFIAPYFLYTEPSVVKNFIRYRIKTLEGAKRKAKSYGFSGAFYAWESQENGDDACSDYNVTDVFTKRPMRTYFKDKQIHISAAVVYLIRQYIDVTGDVSVLLEGGLDVVLECAKFYLSRCVYIPMKDRYELLDVIGPDEYHERVNNNAYTNMMALYTLKTALACLKELKKEHCSFVEDIVHTLEFEKDIPLLKKVSEKLYIPEPENTSNAKNIIPQFDGYFNLEDCSLETVKSRLLDQKEYWGGANGVASGTQIIKQADVVLLLNLFGSSYSDEVKKANLDYYEVRTEHGSSLSSCMHAILFAKLKNVKKAYPFFIKTARVDIDGDSKQFAGLIYIGGTHPAANGGAWMSVIQGFCGFSVESGKIKLNPSLPPSWKKVSFKAIVGGVRYLIKVTKEGYTVCKE